MRAARVAALIALVGTVACGSATEQYMCRSRQAEAKTVLNAVHAAQEAYLADKKKYASSIAELAFTPATDKYYDVVIATASDKAFTATATGKGEAAGDVWTVDQTGKPTPTADKCHAEK